jgi:5'-deoxynucleotidase YfbR-like HD superfamily hydrolase
MDDKNSPIPDNNSGSEKQASDILDELRELGQNLRTLLQSAWESDERKKLQQEIETGVNDLYASLSQAVNEFSSSSTGQALKSDLEDLGERIRSGEVETKVRSEVVSALRAANDSLKKASVDISGPEEIAGP